MNPQMDVLHVKDLGHVLAGFTRASEPAQIEATALSFVGDGLHLRGLAGAEDQDFIVPAPQVGLLRTNLDPSLLRTPRNWYANLTATPPTVVESSQSFTVSKPAASIKITSTMPMAGFAVGTTVHMLIEGKSLGNPLLVPLPPTQAIEKDIDIPVPALAKGSYCAIVFVPLYPITAFPFTVT
jgi:hypothetical protein